MPRGQGRIATALELYGPLKFCPLCEKEKPLAEFNGRGKQGPWLQTYCRPCDSRRSTAAFAGLSSEERKLKSSKNYERRKAKIDEVYVFVNECKDVPCADCGHRYPPYVMDFDHVRGEKVDAIAKMIYQMHNSLEAVKAEIKKCDVVCSNCHRIRTFTRLGKV